MESEQPKKFTKEEAIKNFKVLMKSPPITEITEKQNMMIIRHGFTEANY